MERQFNAQPSVEQNCYEPICKYKGNLKISQKIYLNVRQNILYWDD